MSARTEKLLALRAKTDHDLLVMINRELDRALELVSAANTRNSSVFAQAENAIGIAMTWLPTIGDWSQCDRLWIQAKLKVKRLRSQVRRVPASGSVVLYSPSFAS